MRRIVVLVLTVLAAGALAAPASAGYGRLIGHVRASGGSHAADIGWGARLQRSVRAPHSFTVVVKARLSRGYFCQSSCSEVQVQWDVACRRPGIARSRQGGMFGRPPKVGHPGLPFSRPRSCTVHVRALPSAYVGGRIELWLYYR